MRSSQFINNFLSVSSKSRVLYDIMFEKVALESGLSKAAVDVLVFLINNPKLNTAKDIVQRRNVSKAYVSKGVEMLVQKGLIQAIIDENDRRVQHLFVTKNAAAIEKTLRTTLNEFFEIITKKITSEELDELEIIGKKVSRNIQNVLNEKDEIRS